MDQSACTWLLAFSGFPPDSTRHGSQVSLLLRRASCSARPPVERGSGDGRGASGRFHLTSDTRRDCLSIMALYQRSLARTCELVQLFGYFTIGNRNGRGSSPSALFWSASVHRRRRKSVLCLLLEEGGESDGFLLEPGPRLVGGIVLRFLVLSPRRRTFVSIAV